MNDQECKLCPIYQALWQDKLEVSKKQKSKLRDLKTENAELLELCEESRQMIKKQGRLLKKFAREAAENAETVKLARETIEATLNESEK